jgi:hypothetical protein
VAGGPNKQACSEPHRSDSSHAAPIP